MVGFSTGDIEIPAAMLSGDGGSVDVTKHIRDFQVFEHLQKPYSAIVMTIIDNTGIMDASIKFTGKNYLDLTFNNPGQAPYTNRWLITSAENSQHTQNLRTKIYQISGYSQHMVKLARVQKSFKNVPVTSSIETLVNEFLSPSPKSFIVKDPSKGMIGNDLMPYTINGQQIWKAIRNLMNQSASSSNDSSAYVMYENKDNLVLNTLENILKERGKGPAYYQRPLGQHFIGDDARQAYVILHLRENSRVDRTDTVQAESQATRTFDLFSQGFNAVEAAFGGFSGGGGSSTYQNIPYNVLRPPSYLQNVYAKRKWIASVFDGQSFNVMVPFNSDLTVGSGLSIETVVSSGDLTTPSFKNYDLVATELCHNIRLDRKKMQGISVVRGVTGDGA